MSDDDITGKRIIEWIENRCYVPEGKLIGRPVRLQTWQKKEIRRIYDNKAGSTRTAILSFGRKNGKTALSSFLLLAHLCGPVGYARRNAQLYSTAQSREQAAVIFNLAAKIVRMSPVMRDVVTVRDSAKELLYPNFGTRYRALSADATTAYGLSPSFVVHDELGQVRGPRSALYEAMETATAAQEDPLSIVISTQAPTDADLLSVLIDDAKSGGDPRTTVSLYTAPLDLDPFAEETIRLANPAFGQFQNKKEVMGMAERARRMPAREAEFRNLVLNQRVEASNPFIAPGLWKECAGTLQEVHGLPVYAGLDLSEVSDLTALVVIGKRDRVWHVHPTFWLPENGIADKSRQDRVPYDMWARKGYLQLTPGSSVSYEYVADFLRREIFAKHRVQKLAFDRWNMKHLKPWLIKSGFTEKDLEAHFVEFGQGTQSMSPALRDLEGLILEKQICHGGHPVLAMCASNAVVEGKDSANRKLSKSRSSGRIDGMVALAMAVGVAPLTTKKIDVSSLIG